VRAIVKFVLSLIVVFAIAWVGLWWYVQGRMQAGLQAWADNQAIAGWKISYDSLQRGTSPMQALVIINNLSVTPPPGPGGASVTLRMPDVRLSIDAMNPLVYQISLPGKISLDAGQNIGLVVNSDSIVSREMLDPNGLFDKAVYPFRGGDFSAGNVDILASEGSLLVLHVDRLVSHADLNAQAGSAGTALATTTTLSGVALSPLFSRIARIPFDGKIGTLGFSLSLSGPVPGDLAGLAGRLRAAGATDEVARRKLIMPVVHEWARAGGSGSFGVNLTVGPTTARGSAAVSFDARQQPTGTADLTADHLDAFTGAILDAYPQMQDSVSAAEAQLTPYLTTSDSGGQTLALHVVYGAAGVMVNGQKVADMPALNWQTLENPPAAAPAAAPAQ
jgi:hypothetical protein